MKTTITWTLRAVAVAALMTAGAAMAQDKEPVSPVPAPKAVNPAAVELGKKLFFDPRLSKSGFISCNSRHNLSMGGSDNLKTSIGDHWQQWSVQLAHRAELASEPCAVLGWPCQGPQGPGRRPDRQPG